MFIPALLVFLSSLICKLGGYALPCVLFERPIFTGFLTGLLLGDVQTGILIGAQMELVFMGIVAIGSTQAADALTATAIAVGVAITGGISVEAVLPIGITLGYACVVFNPLTLMVGDLFVPAADKALTEGKQKRFDIVCWVGTILGCAVPCLFAGIAVLFGGDALNAILDVTPMFILTGISAAGAILPALGIGMLASLLWNGKAAIYFFVGFVIAKYLAVDTIFVLVIALLLALSDLFLRMDMGKKTVTAARDAISEEEDFLK